MRSVLIRRFEISDQLTHLFNALFWAVLAAMDGRLEASDNLYD